MPPVGDTHPLRPASAHSANADAGGPDHRGTAVIAHPDLMANSDSGCGVSDVAPTAAASEPPRTNEVTDHDNS
jgi:hypothetical protein